MTEAAAMLLAYEQHDAGNDNPTAYVTVPLLLLHSLALDRHVWDGLLPTLRRHRTVVTVDLRGHGASPPSAEFTIEQMADDVAATLDAAGIERVAVAGLSLGGSVAQAFASRHVDRTSALALIDTTAWYGPDAPAQWAQRAAKGFFKLERAMILKPLLLPARCGCSGTVLGGVGWRRCGIRSRSV